VPTIPSLFDAPSSVVVIVTVPAVGAVVSTVTKALVVESAVVEVFPAVSVTSAWILYVVCDVRPESVIAYGDDVLEEVPFVVHVPPLSVLTCTTTLAMPAPV
jgi:hypothetical protein